MKHLKKFFSALVYAINGLKYFFKNELNGKTQFAIALLAILLSIYLKISIAEWIAVLLCIGIVLSLEMLNAALEKLCDMVQPENDPRIKIIKDVSAAAVLWSSIISTVIGVAIFLPKLIVVFKK